MNQLNVIIKETGDLQDYVHLNLYMLDNRQLKATIVSQIKEIYTFVVDFYLYKNLINNTA